MEMTYGSTLEGLHPTASAFSFGSAQPPVPATLLEMLDASNEFWPALDGIGWSGTSAPSATALCGVPPRTRSAPEYQGLGIGTELLTKLLDDLAGFYSIDGICDDDLVDYYARFGFLRGNGMMIRNYEHQSAR